MSKQCLERLSGNELKMELAFEYKQKFYKNYYHELSKAPPITENKNWLLKLLKTLKWEYFLQKING